MHRRTRLSALAIAVLAGAACDRSPEPSAPRAPDAPRISGPSLSPGSAFVNTRIARANAGEFNWHSNFPGLNIQLLAHDDADIEVTSGVANAGGHSGWHYHPGPVFVLVKTGALTVYDAADPHCRGTTYAAGTTFIEGTTPHIVRNEGAVDAELVGVFFVPAGEPRRIEADPPAHCPF